MLRCHVKEVGFDNGIQGQGRVSQIAQKDGRELVLPGPLFNPAEVNRDPPVLILDSGQELPLFSISFVLLFQGADVVSGCTPFARRRQFSGNGCVIQEEKILDTTASAGVIPVVAVDEEDCPVGQLEPKEKPRVCFRRPGGGKYLRGEPLEAFRSCFPG